MFTLTQDMITAITTAVGTVQGDALAVIGAILPVALGLAGVIWLAKRAFRWFRGMTGGQ